MKKTIYSRKPKKCPQCKSNKVANILYGMPGFSEELEKDLEESKIILGGCCIDVNDPSWKCVDCGQEYFDKRKYINPEDCTG